MKKPLYILLFIPFALFGQENDPCYSINNVYQEIEDANQPITLDLLSGWNMIGYSCVNESDVLDILSPISDKIVIAKNNAGSVYMPEFNFNGIGNLLPNQGYQFKMSETVFGFELCHYHINFHQIEGCTDCEALNFNIWATIDDESCNYDTDGDGVFDADEIIGCLDVLACNFDNVANATDNGGCEFPEEGYDCDGGCPFQMMFNNDINTTSGITICSDDNTELSIQILGEEWYNYNNISWSDGSISANISIQTPSETTSYIINYQNDNINCIDSITVFVNNPEQGYDCDANIVPQYQVGDFAEGGIVFYVDETGQHVLVAALEDLTEVATIDSEGNPGYQWGCFATWLSGADGQAIGTGYQNTMDIVNQGCTTEYGGVTAAQGALNAEINDYSDWYLPSLDELKEMYNTIGNGGSDGNIGGFEYNWYWSSSESNNYGAYDVNFGDGSTGNFSSKTKIVRVRVIRSF